MANRFRHTQFFIDAKLCIGDEARGPGVGPSLTDTLWTDVRLAITGLGGDIRLILVADKSTLDSSVPWDPVNTSAVLFEYISNDWRIVAYNETDRFIHWHGGRGIGDYKVLFRNENDTRRFLRAFTDGRAKADELANMDTERLSLRRFVILEELRRHVDEADEGNGPFEEGH